VGGGGGGVGGGGGGKSVYTENSTGTYTFTGKSKYYKEGLGEKTLQACWKGGGRRSRREGGSLIDKRGTGGPRSSISRQNPKKRNPQKKSARLLRGGRLKR